MYCTSASTLCTENAVIAIRIVDIRLVKCSKSRIGDPVGQQTAMASGLKWRPQPTRFHTPLRVSAGIFLPFQAMGTGRWGEPPKLLTGFHPGLLWLSFADPRIGAPQLTVQRRVGRLRSWAAQRGIGEPVRLAVGRDECRFQRSTMKHTKFRHTPEGRRAGRHGR